MVARGQLEIHSFRSLCSSLPLSINRPVMGNLSEGLLCVCCVVWCQLVTVVSAVGGAGLFLALAWPLRW